MDKRITLRAVLISFSSSVFLANGLETLGKLENVLKPEVRVAASKLTFQPRESLIREFSPRDFLWRFLEPLFGPYMKFLYVKYFSNRPRNYLALFPFSLFSILRAIQNASRPKKSSIGKKRQGILAEKHFHALYSHVNSQEDWLLVLEDDASPVEDDHVWSKLKIVLAQNLEIPVVLDLNSHFSLGELFPGSEAIKTNEQGFLVTAPYFGTAVGYAINLAASKLITESFLHKPWLKRVAADWGLNFAILATLKRGEVILGLRPPKSMVDNLSLIRGLTSIGTSPTAFRLDNNVAAK